MSTKGLGNCIVVEQERPLFKISSLTNANSIRERNTGPKNHGTTQKFRSMARDIT